MNPVKELHFDREKWRETLVLSIWLPTAISLSLERNWVGLALHFALLLALILLFRYSHRFSFTALTSRLQTTVKTQGQSPGPGRAGVIFTLGLHSAKPGSVVRQVLDSLKPQYVAFLGTEKTDESRIVEQLVADYSLKHDHYHRATVDPIGVAEIKREAEGLIDWMVARGVRRGDLLVDLTGGTVPMSLAVFLVASGRKIDCQYIASQHDPARNQVIPGDHKPVMLPP